MEQRDRDAIDRFCQKFSSKINILTLWPRLIQNKVFNRDDVNVPAWEKNLAHRDTVRDILSTIKTRGPRAFENLALSLRQTDQHDLADLLQGLETLSSDSDNYSSTNSESIGDDSVNDDYHEKLHDATQPLRINVRKATQFCDNPDLNIIGKYRMRSRPRGYVLIITNIRYELKSSRNAAERDEASLKKLFEDMGFDVTSKLNLIGAEIRKTVDEFSRRDFHLIDSCFVIISAHGGEKINKGFLDTEIEGIDTGLSSASSVMCSDIVDYFVAEKCKTLIGKPKIFIFQACRGQRMQEPPRVDSDGFEENVPPRNYSDMLIAHSTIPGHVAYRNTVNGSWYIQILCEVFMNHACTTHVQDLFNLVDRRLMRYRTHDNKSQTSTIKSMGFNKHCYLNPGLFEDS